MTRQEHIISKATVKIEAQNDILLMHDNRLIKDIAQQIQEQLIKINQEIGLE